jgi:hypothetical protein
MLENNEEKKFKKFANYYLSFACLLGYHKQIQEKVDDEL